VPPLTTHYSGRKGGTAWREKSTSTGSWMFRAGTFPSSLQGSEGSAGTTLPCIGSNVAGGDVRLKAHRDRGGRPGAVAPSRGLAGGSGCRVGRCGRWWRQHTMEKIMWRPGAIEGMASRALWIDKYAFLCERRRGHTRRAGGGVVPGRARERVLSPCGHSTHSASAWVAASLEWCAMPWVRGPGVWPMGPVWSQEGDLGPVSAGGQRALLHGDGRKYSMTLRAGRDIGKNREE
jgi:hypothetical protein